MNDREARDRERLADYLEGRLPLDQQRAFEQELLQDPSASGELYEELGVREMLRSASRQKTAVVRRLYWLAPLAAAALVLLMVLPLREPTEEVLRGEIAELEIVEPGNQVSGEFVLRWRSVPGAATYEVAIFSADARALRSESTPDTALVVADIDTGAKAIKGAIGREPNCLVIDDATYRKLNGGRLQPVLDTFITLHRLGVHFEITHLVVPGYGDRPEMIRRMCGWITANLGPGYPLHLLRFFPRYRLDRLAPTPVDTLVSFRELAMAEGVQYVYLGNIPGEPIFIGKKKMSGMHRRGFVRFG